MPEEEEALFAGANKGNENDAPNGDENPNGGTPNNESNNSEQEEQHQEEESSNENEEEQEESNENEEEESEEELPLIVALESKTGFSFIGDDGNKKVYEDTEDGLAAYILDVTTKVEQDTIEKAKTAAINAINPRVREFHNHIEAGNSEESFFSDPLKDIQNVTLQNDDKETAKRIIRLRANLEGYSADMVEKKLKGYEAADILVDTALEDLTFLQKKDVETKQKNAEIVKQRAEKQEEESREYITKVTQLVKEGKIDGVNVPIQERDNVLKYLFQPVKDGKSQHDLDLEAEPLEKDLFYAYLRMKKGDLSSLIQKGVNKAQVKSLRDRVAGNSRNSHKPTEKQSASVLNFE